MRGDTMKFVGLLFKGMSKISVGRSSQIPFYKSQFTIQLKNKRASKQGKNSTTKTNNLDRVRESERAVQTGFQSSLRSTNVRQRL